MPTPEQPELLDPEVLPPERESTNKRSWSERAQRALSPVVAGMLIDAVDLFTFGPFGLMFGMLLGGTAAYWMASICHLPLWQRFLAALLAGLYCSFPRTSALPLATMLGIIVRFLSDD